MAQPVKRCNCRDQNGKKLGQKCPKLSKRDHGAWWVRYEAPPGPDGKRRRPWAGPYRTDAAKDLRRLQSEADAGLPVTDRNMKFGEWLDLWIAGKKRLKPSTRDSYLEAIRLYGKPGLGHVPLDQVNEGHLAALYEAMAQINDLPEGTRPSEMLRRLLAARALAPWKYARDDEGNRLQQLLTEQKQPEPAQAAVGRAHPTSAPGAVVGSRHGLQDQEDQAQPGRARRAAEGPQGAPPGLDGRADRALEGDRAGAGPGHGVATGHRGTVPRCVRAARGEALSAVSPRDDPGPAPG
jgi:hypothetical protein